MKDSIYIHIGPHLGLMVAHNTPTFAPNEEEYLRKTPILNWVRGLFQNLDDADRKEALGFFPELAELDDERIGRLLYCIVRDNTAVKAVLEANGVAVDRALEYLESHKGKNYVHENPMTAKFHKPEDGVKYDMYFEEAQAYIEKRGFDVPWNDGDVFVDKDYLVQTVANIIRWADENGSEWSEGLLKEEIEKRYDRAKWGYVDGFGEVCMDKDQFVRIARHFAKWGAKHLKK